MHLNLYKIINFLIHYTNLLEEFELMEQRFKKKNSFLSILKINLQKWLLILKIPFVKIKVNKMIDWNDFNLKILSLLWFGNSLKRV